MTQQRPDDALSLFWAPICAVGSHGPDGPNACISVSLFGASIVPDQPRLIAGLYKTNYTSDLVSAASTLAITVLAQGQVELLSSLGLDSGRGRRKLEGLDYALTALGDPFFPDGSAMIDCSVIDHMDAGDALFFLCRVNERRWLTDAPPLDLRDAMQLVGDTFMTRWLQKQQREQEASRAAMHW